MKQLKDIKAVCDFIKEKSSSYSKEFGFYVEHLQQALEDLKQILESKKNKKISDKDLARVLKCINNTEYSVRIEERTTGTESALACSPLELVEFIIQNAQDKDFLLSQKGGKKSRDFLASALDGGRVDIAELLIKNGVEFKKDYLKELRYAWDDILDIEAQTKKFECLGIKKGETLKKIWDLLSPFSIGEIYTEAFSYYHSVHNYRDTFTGAQQVFIYALKNKLFSEEVLDNSFQGLPPQGGINLAVLGKEGADLLDNDTAYAPLRTQRIVPFVFAMFEDKTYDVLEYALFLGLHKGRKNDKGEDFESFLQQKIDEYIILTTKGGNSYGTIFQEDKDALAYFKALQRFMSSLDSIKRGEVIEVDNETLAMFANIEEIPLSSLDTSKVTSMESCFARSIRRDFSGIEKWNVSQVKNFISCFENAYFFNASLESWQVLKIANTACMFDNALSLKTLPSWY